MAFHNTAFYNLQEEILFAGFISNSIIFLVLKENVNKVGLVHTTDFEFGFPDEEIESFEKKKLMQFFYIS